MTRLGRPPKPHPLTLPVSFGATRELRMALMAEAKKRGVTLSAMLREAAEKLVNA